MRRYSIVHAIPLSFFSGDLYRDVARSWRGIGLVYLCLVVALLTLGVVIQMQLALTGWTRGAGRGYADQFPRIVIRHQVVEVDAAMPFTIVDPSTGVPFAIVDTTGQVVSLDGLEARVLMTRDHIVYRKSAAETRVFNLSGVKDFTIDSARVRRWLGVLSTWAAPVAALFVFAGFFCFRLVQQLLLALVGLAVGRLAGARLDFSALMRLAAVALTPALLVEPVLDLMRAKPRGFGLIWIALALAYIVWAVRANRPDPTGAATGDPVAPQAPA